MEIADIIWYDDHGWPFQRSTQQKQKKRPWVKIRAPAQNLLGVLSIKHQISYNIPYGYLT